MTITNDSLKINVDIIFEEMIEKRLFLITSALDSLSYTVKIDNLSCKKGNENRNLSINFNSIGVTDNKNPKIVQTIPKNGSVVRDQTPKISISFDKIMFAGDVKITMKEVESNKTIKLIPQNSAGFTLNYTPQYDLKEFNSYQLIILNDTKDKNGNQLLEEQIIQFIKL